ncbi:MAG: radical SAM protein [Oligoflexia bacterium]|nr:radical SAM protein [Oligoflexia bacterium]
MYQYSQIKTVHLELSSKCNASCPMCLRSICGGVLNPQLPLTELSLEDIKQIMPVDFLKQLKRIYMCGNYGDPIIAKDTLEIFKFFRKVNSSLSLSLFTNAGAKNPTWWKELAQIVNSVHFSIDGLEDTNSIYRRGTDFKKIMKNAESYIAEGGYAIWDFIVFHHNEHQVKKAQQKSKEMGFAEFVIKKTGRFFSNQKSKVKTEQIILDKKGQPDGVLKLPKNPQYQNRSLQKEQELSKKHGSLHNYLNQTKITCKVSEEKSLYLSAEAFVFPCCWTANQLYPWYFRKNSSQIWKMIDRLPERESSLNAKKYSIKEIVHGDFFQKMIPNSWQATDITTDRLKVCAKTCGKDFTPFTDQFVSG